MKAKLTSFGQKAASRRSRRMWVAALTVALLATGAAAQQARNVQTDLPRLPAPGRTVASADDTTALVVNPATLAFMPGEEMRWTSSYLQEAAQLASQGHSLALGFPVPLLSLATGVRMDFVDPPDGLSVPFTEYQNYQWLTWGLAVSSGDQAAVGLSLQRTFSSSSLLDGLASWSLGFASRPYDTFGVGFVVHHLNAPRKSGPPMLRGGSAERTFDFGLDLRPFGTRTVALGLESRYVDVAGGFWVPRATLGIDVPYVGRLHGDFSISDPSDEVWKGNLSDEEWLASVGLAFDLNFPTGAMELAGGSVFGSRLGPDAEDKFQRNVYTEVAFKNWREPVGPALPRFAVRIRLEDTPGIREHVKLLRRLWQLADEPTLDAVLLELRSPPAASLAQAQELRDAIQNLRQSGKRVMCHLEDAKGVALYTCAAANRILMNPAGGLRFAGMRTRTFYYAGLLKKLGVRADFVRIGAHKSAPEAFTRDGGTRVARRDKIDLLQQFERQVVEGIATGRRMTVAQVRQRLAQGPFIATEAKAAGLIDGFAFDDQLEDKVVEMVGRDVLLVDEIKPEAPLRFGSGQRIALVYADGDIVDGRSQAFPLIDLDLLGSYSMAETLKQVREDPRIGAVVLRIDSPGGSAMAADVIWRQVQLTARVKPVVVSMGNVAASGGYYIAAPATHIVANPLSLTGSIGIYYGKADVAGLLNKIGVNVEVYKTAPRADAESIFRPYTPDERRELKRKVGQFYSTFVSRVALGRSLTNQQVNAVGQGRVWTGEQAHAKRLVDELGGLRQALAYARQLANLPDSAPIDELPLPKTTLLGRLLGIEGVQDGTPLSALPLQLTEAVHALLPFAIFSGDQPLALMELTSVGF